MDRVPSDDGVVLALHDLGGDGEPVLLAHATGFCGPIWAPVVAHLDGFHAYAPDMRGHGHSTRPEGSSLDWRDIALDLFAVLDHLGVERVKAAGHSMGATCLLLAEMSRPGTFERLWLYDPVVRPASSTLSDSEVNLAGGARRRRATFPSPEAAYENFSAKPPLASLVPEALSAYVEHGFAPGEDGSVTLRCRPEDEAEIYERGAWNGAFERLGEVACPTVVAHGDFEEGRPSAWAPEVAARLPAGREVVFAGASHFGPLEQPGRAARSIRDLFGDR